MSFSCPGGPMMISKWSLLDWFWYDIPTSFLVF
jgi:hypothetical protein